MKIKNIGPDDRHIPAAKLTIKAGEVGEVPDQIAIEFANEEPERWQLAEVKKADKKAGDK